MTARDQLRQVVDGLSEREAEKLLDIIARRREHDPMVAVFEDAPEDDEPVTAE